MFGNVQVRKASERRETETFYKIANKPPKGECKWVEGSLVRTGFNEEGLPLYPDHLGPINAVLLSFHAERAWVKWDDSNNTSTTLCFSPDSVKPDPSIASPFCNKMDLPLLEEAIRTKELKYAKLSGAALEKEVSRRLEVLTEGGDQLVRCCNERGWPVCPKGYDYDEGAMGKCKYAEVTRWLDLDRDIMFAFVLKGFDTRDSKEFVSPFREFQAWLMDQCLDPADDTGQTLLHQMHEFQVVLEVGSGPRNSHVLDVQAPRFIEDEVVLSAAAQSASKAAQLQESRTKDVLSRLQQVAT